MRRSFPKAAEGKGYKTTKGEELFVVFVLRPDFTVIDNGQMAICVPPGNVLGMPIEAFVRLYVLRDKQAPVLIGRMGELRGLVRVGSPHAALSFVRLFTSLKTHYLFQPPKIAPLLDPSRNQPEQGKLEVIAQERLDPGCFFGDKKDYEVFRHRLQAWGITSRALTDRYHLPPATAVSAGSGFRVKRVLAVQYGHPDLDPMNLFLIQEWVGPDGTYLIERVTPFGQDVNKALDVQMRTYE